MYTHLLIKLRRRSKEQPASKRTVHHPLFPDHLLIKAIQDESDCQRSPLAGVITQLASQKGWPLNQNISWSSSMLERNSPVRGPGGACGSAA